MFTVRYGQSPYMKQKRFVFKALIRLFSSLIQGSEVELVFHLFINPPLPLFPLEAYAYALYESPILALHLLLVCNFDMLVSFNLITLSNLSSQPNKL